MERLITPEMTARALARVVENNTPKKRKGIMVNVYRSDSIGDCTNGGATSKADRVLLVGGGMPEIFEEQEGIPTLELRARFIGDEEYMHAEPAGAPKGVGWMMGGNFVYSSDSRFRDICRYPIPVHDRTESRELYASMNR